MLLWRSIPLAVFFEAAPISVYLPIVLALFLVYVTHNTIVTWPIFYLIFKQHNPIHPLPKWMRGKRWSQVYKPTTTKDITPLLDKATTKGPRTGFEPYLLDKVVLQKKPWIIGNPGVGLDSSGFSSANIRAGQAGEINFAKALQEEGIIDKFQSYWSVALPRAEDFTASRKYNTDVDCVLFTGRTVYLVDLKNYKGGACTYSMAGETLKLQDDATGQFIKAPAATSRNMAMARDLFTPHLSKERYTVKTRVVFMPQNNGEANINQVYWPGYITASTLREFLQELKAEAEFYNGRDHSAFHNGMATLIKT